MMFRKVLIAEDLGWNTRNIEEEVKRLGAQEFVVTQYCDDAYLKFLRALNDEAPFDLLISDLSFKEDHRTQKLKSGDELISAVRKYQKNLNIIVFSMEERLQRIRFLFEELNINAYVFKSRQSLKHLSAALDAIANDKLYISPQVAKALEKRHSLDIEDYDFMLLKKLSIGLSNKEVSDYFKEHDISPNGISSIEKRINRLRIQFKANNAVHLISNAKDLGLI